MYMRHYSYNYWVWRAYSQPLEDHLAEYGGLVEAETAYRLLVDNCLQTQAIVPNQIMPGVDQRLFSKRYNMRIWITTFELFLKLSMCSWAFREREKGGGALDSFFKVQ
jgi:hypothetical protein